MNLSKTMPLYSANFWRGDGKPQRMPNRAQNLTSSKESPRSETQFTLAPERN
jgi:hypothetical protein